jgi:predicted deacetylase
MLLSRSAGGSEIVLHGLEHRAESRLEGPPLDRLRGRLFADGAAEFLSLEEAEARSAIGRGMEALRAAGFPRPSTFCAPGWLLRRDLQPMLLEAGLRRVAGMFSVRDLLSQRSRHHTSFGYVGAGAAHQLGLDTLNRMAALATRGSHTVVAYLHPQGASNARATQSVLDRIAAMVQEGWHPATYAEAYARPSD